MRPTLVLLAVVISLLASVESLRAADPPRSPEPMPAKAPDDELRRRAMFGAQLAPVTKEVQERQKLDGAGGVVLEKISGGIYSTVGDLAHWLKLQLSEGTYGNRRLLKPETVREMHALQLSVPVRSRPKGNIYAARFYGSGLGSFVQDYRGRKIVLHGGSPPSSRGARSRWPRLPSWPP